MLYNLFRDACHIVCLRFERPEHYRYSAPASIAVLLLLGIIKAVGMSPIFGNSPAAVALSMLIALIQCLALAAGMRLALSKKMPQNVSWWGFVLASESLIFPALIAVYVPQLAVLVGLWNIWILWVQIAGFVRLSQQSIGRVMLGYLYYFLLGMLAGSAVLVLFDSSGWIDMQAVMENFQNLLQQTRS